MKREKCNCMICNGEHVASALSAGQVAILSRAPDQTGRAAEGEMHDADIRAYLRFRWNERLAQLAVANTSNPTA